MIKCKRMLALIRQVRRSQLKADRSSLPCACVPNVLLQHTLQLALREVWMPAEVSGAIKATRASAKQSTVEASGGKCYIYPHTEYASSPSFAPLYH